MAVKLVLGTIVARAIIPAAILRASTTLGKYAIKIQATFSLSLSLLRCFVGDEPDQWRKCSDRYYPGNHTSTLTHSGYTIKPSTHKRKPIGDSHSSASTSEEFQKPGRPTDLQSLSDFAAARLWPVTYLYSEGPPNSTEFSNFVDCNKETC